MEKASVIVSNKDVTGRAYGEVLGKNPSVLNAGKRIN